MRHGNPWAPCFAQAQGTPRILIKSIFLRPVLQFRNITPSLRSPPSLISGFETRNFPCPRCGLKDNRRRSELWNSIDGEVSPWPGSTRPVWYLPFLPQQPRVAPTPAAAYCQIICASVFRLPAERSHRLRISSILIYQQPHTATGRQASVECIWGLLQQWIQGPAGWGWTPWPTNQILRTRIAPRHARHCLRHKPPCRDWLPWACPWAAVGAQLQASSGPYRPLRHSGDAPILQLICTCPACPACSG
jgi:hypothetical protein